LEEVSNEVGFNPTYFSSLFKKETGYTFLEYLSEIRMNRAKELLKETNFSIAVICEEVGYSDLKHFTKMFIKHTNLKPNEYRKLYS
jgi:two-component system response regulator YesN